jgi:DNA-binding transcriptional regulator GbsR (MarR family)
MNLDEAKEKYIQAWGALGSQWGVNRTMAQIHALLMVAPEPLSAEDIMTQLNISRGNANMNLRALIDWGLVRREFKSGERKEFFSAEKDIWLVARRILIERKKRELEPMLKVLDEIGTTDADPKDPQVRAFNDTIAQIRDFAQKTNNALEQVTRAEGSWFWTMLSKIFK